MPNSWAVDCHQLQSAQQQPKRTLQPFSAYCANRPSVSGICVDSVVVQELALRSGRVSVDQTVSHRCKDTSLQVTNGQWLAPFPDASLQLAYHFATQPEICERAAAEVHKLLSQRAGDVMRLCADDLPLLPYLTACVMETLRLVPAGPMTRTAQKVSQQTC